jgi:hypothetical protein
VGSVLARLVFAGGAVSAYSGEKAVFARLALVYDLDLREWPFTVDPTVVRRVRKVGGKLDTGRP